MKIKKLWQPLEVQVSSAQCLGDIPSMTHQAGSCACLSASPAFPALAAQEVGGGRIRSVP